MVLNDYETKNKQAQWTSPYPYIMRAILSDLSSTAQTMHLQKHITFEPKLNELQVAKGCPWCNHRYCKEQSSQTANYIHKNIECKLIWPLTFSSSTCTISVQFLSSTSVAFKGLTLTATLNKDNHTDTNEQTLIQGRKTNSQPSTHNLHMQTVSQRSH